MINVALFGNPNVGKTTVFNLLTGSNQYVGNWPGVTIDKKEGFLGKDIKIVDLPGIYAMDTFSNEEKVSKEYSIEEAVEKGTKQLEQQIESEIEEKNNIVRKKCKCNKNRRICRSKRNIWSYWKYRNAGKNR